MRGMEEKGHSRGIWWICSKTGPENFSRQISQTQEPGRKKWRRKDHWKCCIHLGWWLDYQIYVSLGQKDGLEKNCCSTSLDHNLNNLSDWEAIKKTTCNEHEKKTKKSCWFFCCVSKMWRTAALNFCALPFLIFFVIKYLQLFWFYDIM